MGAGRNLETRAKQICDRKSDYFNGKELVHLAMS